MRKFYFKQLLTALLLLCSTIASAHDFEVDGIYYNITHTVNKTVAVTYRGSSYSEYSNEYTGDVVIPQSVTYNGSTYRVTSIGNHAFYNCSGLTSIEIPNSVTSIGDEAFYYCSGLTNVTIGNSVTSIGKNAFYYCKGLTSIEIPNSVTSIGDEAFFNCDGLTSIEIPNSVTNIGYRAFFGCKGLTSIEIPNSVTSIGNEAFYYCSGLTSIVVKEGNTVYDSRNNCNAVIETATNTLVVGCKNTIIPDGITSIGMGAFYGCDGLTSIEIPNSVTSIEGSAFSRCYGLKSVVIPNSVTSIGGSAFFDCSSLTSITIPNSVTSIGDGAFSSCSGLKSVVIPNSVTSIGDEAFFNCYGLTSVKSYILAENLFAIDSYVFYNVDKNTCTLYVPAGAKETYAATSGWHKFTNIVELEAPGINGTCGDNATWSLVDGVLTISGTGAMYDYTSDSPAPWYDYKDEITSAIIEDGVTSIGNYAFYYCFHLTSIVIPNSVTSIGDDAFGNCRSLTSITIPGSVTSIGNYAFYYCLGLTSIVIPNSVTSIGDDAFSYCIVLTSIEIPNSVTSIGDDAFSYCSSLTSIEIPNSVTSIGNSAFFGCEGLTSIEIPNSVTSIGDDAFHTCYGLKSVVIPNSVTSIGERTFAYCYDLTSIEIPNSVTSIGNYAFYYCLGLTSIEIPNSVTSIGEGAFYGCSSLASITSLIPADKLFEIDSNVFSGVDKNSCTLYVPAGAKETYAATSGWHKFTNIVELPASFDLTISAAKYATLYLDYNAVIPAGVRVYYAEKIEGETLLMERITDVIPANTGVIVTGAAGTYTFEESAEAVAAIESNLFRGSVEDTYITPEKGTKYYVLSIVDGVVGMYIDELAGGTFKNNAHKAYLPLDGESLGIFDTTVNSPSAQLSNRYTFNFGGTTAVEVVNAEKASDAIYNLNGVRVENPTKGIYIVNGKKVVY